MSSLNGVFMPFLGQKNGAQAYLTTIIILLMLKYKLSNSTKVRDCIKEIILKRAYQRIDT